MLVGTKIKIHNHRRSRKRSSSSGNSRACTCLFKTPFVSNNSRSFSSASSSSSATARNNRNVALVFPGQGSQIVGMGKDLVEQFPFSKRIFQEIDSYMGSDVCLSRLMFEGPMETLKQTENAQPAILAHSMVVLEILKSSGISVSSFGVVLGHSLGEFSALCAAESISLQDAIKLVRKRGKSMQECVGNRVGDYGMAAFFPIDLPTATTLASRATQQTGKTCDIANINSPQQIVLSGESLAIDAAISICKKDFGRVRAKKLEVSAPFHSSIMKPAQEAMKPVIQSANVKPPIVPLISNVTGEQVRDPATVKDLLVQQITASVKWHQSITYCQQQGITSFVEVGPGKVLAGLIKQISPQLQCQSIGTAAELRSFIKSNT